MAVVLGVAAVVIGLLVGQRLPAGAQTGPQPPRPDPRQDRLERLRAALDEAADAEQRRQEISQEFRLLSDQIDDPDADRDALRQRLGELSDRGAAATRLAEARKREAMTLILEDLDEQVAEARAETDELADQGDFSGARAARQRANQLQERADAAHDEAADIEASGDLDVPFRRVDFLDRQLPGVAPELIDLLDVHKEKADEPLPDDPLFTGGETDPLFTGEVFDGLFGDNGEGGIAQLDEFPGQDPIQFQAQREEAFRRAVGDDFADVIQALIKAGATQAEAAGMMRDIIDGQLGPDQAENMLARLRLEKELMGLSYAEFALSDAEAEFERTQQEDVSEQEEIQARQALGEAQERAARAQRDLPGIVERLAKLNGRAVEEVERRLEQIGDPAKRSAAEEFLKGLREQAATMAEEAARLNPDDEELQRRAVEARRKAPLGVPDADGPAPVGQAPPEVAPADGQQPRTVQETLDERLSNLRQRIVDSAGRLGRGQQPTDQQPEEGPGAGEEPGGEPGQQDPEQQDPEQQNTQQQDQSGEQEDPNNPRRQTPENNLLPNPLTDPQTDPQTDSETPPQTDPDAETDADPDALAPEEVPTLNPDGVPIETNAAGGGGGGTLTPTPELCQLDPACQPPEPTGDPCVNPPAGILVNCPPPEPPTVVTDPPAPQEPQPGCPGGPPVPAGTLVTCPEVEPPPTAVTDPPPPEQPQPGCPGGPPVPAGTLVTCPTPAPELGGVLTAAAVPPPAPITPLAPPPPPAPPAPAPPPPPPPPQRTSSSNNNDEPPQPAPEVAQPTPEVAQPTPAPAPPPPPPEVAQPTPAPAPQPAPAPPPPAPPAPTPQPRPVTPLNIPPELRDEPPASAALDQHERHDPTPAPAPAPEPVFREIDPNEIVVSQGPVTPSPLADIINPQPAQPQQDPIGSIFDNQSPLTVFDEPDPAPQQTSNPFGLGGMTPIGSTVVQLPELSTQNPVTTPDSGGTIEDLFGGGSGPPAGGFDLGDCSSIC